MPRKRTPREIMESFPKREEMGEYYAEAGGLGAELKLHTELHFIAVVDSGTDWYVADFKFYTKPVSQGEKEGYSVSIHYSSNSFNDIFNRLKRAEEGIEHLLSTECGTNASEQWKLSREVIQCILSLQKQTAYIPEKREKAELKRKRKLYPGEY